MLWKNPFERGTLSEYKGGFYLSAIVFLEEKEKRVNWDKDPLTKAVGKVKLTVTDASVNHDQYGSGGLKVYKNRRDSVYHRKECNVFFSNQA